MRPRHEANPQENNNAEARSQQSRFATLLKPHPRTDTPPKIRSTSADHLPPGVNLWGTASACQNNFKIMKSFYLVVKRNLLAIKNG